MSTIVTGDADALVALTDDRDSNHDQAQKISEWLFSKSYEVIFPNTAILEAITALKRAKNLPDKAHFLNKQYQEGIFSIKFIDHKTQLLASKIFDKAVSKQNTIFDAIVASCARTLEADGIFSFDNWYEKLGFRLAKDLT